MRARTFAPLLMAGLLITLILATCGGSDDDSPSDSEPSPTPMPAPTAEETVLDTISPALVHLQQDYETLTGTHEAMNDIWTALRDNEEVVCNGEYPTLVPPESITDEGETALEPLAASLRQAAIQLDTSVRLWRAVCESPRRIPQRATVQEGWLATQDAGDALRDAEPMLSSIQG